MSQKFVDDLSDDYKKKTFEFLKFHYGVVKRTGMPYAREFATIDFLTDSATIGFNYEGAEKYLNLLQDNNILDYDQHGAFPGTRITKKGESVLKILAEEFDPSMLNIFTDSKSSPTKSRDSSESKEKYVQKPPQMHVWGKTQDLSQHPILKELNITEDLIYRFLKFQIGVIRRTGVPYLRELVAEDFLGDMEHLSFKQTSEFLEVLIKDGYNEYDQWGAFPGTGITKKGREYFEFLAKKLGKELS
ncbi:hypothetical protein NEF87_001212 [Candidatus Lokiarchaeum ossiferum]|uniref:ArnR1-like winged helix-turn-helix domain-containing protein n=1 Tax=Candidatus Lokiarchaeum ossiferum TaxID=2951803 RepID=A0ABY6HN54_9ARCH|nr:hypothetical protein NEF87_001212 [Candidatus Lokiarchaeum sp. B-35]